MKLLVRLWLIIIGWFQFSEPSRMQGIIPDPNPKIRKKHDTTKITQYQYDWILEQNTLRLIFNARSSNKEKVYFYDFADRLNTKFGLNKSANTYAYICRGVTKRENLIAGTPIDMVSL